MKISDIKTDLLKQLANHLLSDKTGHEHFDFAHYHCLTSGCAIGECPFVWPDLWEFEVTGLPVLKNVRFREGWPDKSARIFFNISSRMFTHLFIPDSQINDWLDYSSASHLDRYASKEQVANNILHFCSLVESGNLPGYE